MAIFNRYRFLFIILAALFPVLSGSQALCQSQASVIFVKGDPKIMKDAKSEWEACAAGIAIDNGDRVKTVKDQMVEISFLNDKSNIVRIEGDSDVFIRKSEAPYYIELLNGSAMAMITKLPKKSTFEIATPVGLSGARGTGWRASTDGRASIFQAFEHFIYVNGYDQAGKPKGSLLIRSGWQTLLNRFETPQRLEKLSSGDMARWNDWRRDLGSRVNEISQRLERAGALEGRLGELQSKKLDVKESRDNSRVEGRQETSRSGGDGGGDNRYNIGE